MSPIDWDPCRWDPCRGIEPRLDELLGRHLVLSWAFVTAFNPRSQALAPEENDRRQALLESEACNQYFVFTGEGIADAGDWPPERSALILGIERQAAFELGQRFGQLAIVLGQEKFPPELVRCL